MPIVESAVVAGLLAAGAAGATKTKQNTLVKKSVKELAKSLQKVSSATEGVVKGTTVMTEDVLRGMTGMKKKSSRRRRSRRGGRKAGPTKRRKTARKGKKRSTRRRRR